jgi:hypothetical protein
MKTLKSMWKFIKSIFKTPTCTGTCEQGRKPCDRNCLRLTKEQEEELKSALERNSKYHYGDLDGRNH